MSQFYGSPRNKPRAAKPTGPFVKVDTFISQETYRIMKVASEAKRVPISRLVAIAIDNELDEANSFNYPCEWPEADFVEGAYFGEAQRLFQFLRNMQKGADIETLVLCRRDMGIESRETLLRALRELKQTGLIEEYHPKRTVFHYGPDYMRYRVIEEDPRDLKERRYKEPKLAGSEDNAKE